jgi:hypothetical protein
MQFNNADWNDSVMIKLPCHEEFQLNKAFTTGADMMMLRIQELINDATVLRSLLIQRRNRG